VSVFSGFGECLLDGHTFAPAPLTESSTCSHYETQECAGRDHEVVVPCRCREHVQGTRAGKALHPSMLTALLSALGSEDLPLYMVCTPLYWKLYAIRRKCGLLVPSCSCMWGRGRREGWLRPPSLGWDHVVWTRSDSVSGCISPVNMSKMRLSASRLSCGVGCT